jgi:hypothetical protein
VVRVDGTSRLWGELRVPFLQYKHSWGSRPGVGGRKTLIRANECWKLHTIQGAHYQKVLVFPIADAVEMDEDL